MNVTYNKKQLAKIINNHNVANGKKYTEANITDDMIGVFESKFGKFLDVNPNYDPYTGDTYTGRLDDEFIGLLENVCKMNNIQLIPESKFVTSVLKKGETVLEKAISRQLSHKRKKFVYESLVKEGKLRVSLKDRHTNNIAAIVEKLNGYFAKRAPKDQVLKYFGINIYEACVNEHCQNAIQMYLNSVAEDTATSKDLEDLISLIDSGEYDDIEKVEKLKELIYLFASNVSSENSGVPDAVQLNQDILKLSREIHSEKAAAGGDNATVVNTVTEMHLVGEDAIEAIITPAVDLRLVETRNGISKVSWDDTHYYINENLLVAKQQPIKEDAFLDVPAATLDKLATGGVYNYHDTPVKFDSVVPDAELNTQFLFIAITSDGTATEIMIGFDDINDVQVDVPTLNNMVPPSYDTQGVTFEITGALNLKFTKKSTQFVTLQMLFSDLAMCGFVLVADDDNQRWYLTHTECGL